MNFYGLLGVPCSIRSLAGFLLTGFLLASPGALMPVWNYHVQTNYAAPGLCFLCLSLGVIVAVEGSRKLQPPQPIARLRWIGCAMACAAMLLLGTLPSIGAAGGKMFGCLLIGLSCGLVNTTLFDALSPMTRRNPAAVATGAGAFFALGCLLAAVLAALAFNGEANAWLWAVAALLPGIFAILYARCAFPPRDPVGTASISQAAGEFHRPERFLLAFILFFQFGSEWSIGGWLPIFLIHRVGMSPETSLVLLSVYWLGLFAGRIAAFRLLWGRFHGRTLLLAAWTALFGCVILLKTDNRFGAWTGVLLTAAGFAGLTPLVLQRIRRCFPDYHPGFFNGVFAFAIAGGMLCPALLGFLANSSGIWVVIGWPFFGTALMILLLSFLWIEDSLRGRARA